MRTCLILLLAAGLGLAAAPPMPTRHVDRFGDPLPAAALARLGSARFRTGQPIRSLAVSPDGKQLVAGTVSEVQVFDARTGRRCCVLEGPPEARGFISLAFSRDGRSLLSGTQTGHLCRWDAGTGKALRFLDLHRTIRNVAWSPQGRRAAVTEPSGQAELWDLTTGRRLLDLSGPRTIPSPPQLTIFVPDNPPPPPGPAPVPAVTAPAPVGVPRPPAVVPSRPVQHLSFSSDGKRLALVLAVRPAPHQQPGARVEVVEAGTGKPITSIDFKEPQTVHFTPDGKYLLCTGTTGRLNLGLPKLELREVTGGKVVQTFEGAKGQAAGPAFSPRGDRLAVVHVPHGARTQPARIGLWDVASGRFLRDLESSLDGEVQALAFAPDGRTVHAGTPRGVIRAWDAATGKEKGTAAHPAARVHHLTWTADGRVVTASGDGRVRFWEARTGKLLNTLGPWDESLVAVQVSRDNRMLLTWGTGGRSLLGGRVFRLIDLASGKERPLPSGIPVTSWPELSPDGQWLVFQKGGEVCLWGLTGRRERHTLAGQIGAPQESSFSPDGRFLVTRIHNKVRQLWELDEGHPRLRAQAICLLDVAFNTSLLRSCFSADSRTLFCLSESRNRLVEIETASGAQRGPFVIPGAGGPMGLLLAAHTGFDFDVVKGRVRLWSLNNRGRTIELPGEWLDAAPAFSPDGRLLASATGDGSVLVWDSQRLLPWLRPTDVVRKRADLERCWSALASADPHVARAASAELSGDPTRAVPFLARRLKPPPDRDPRLVRLVAELDSDVCVVRCRAEVELRLLGEMAVVPLREGLAGDLSLHARRTVEKLLRDPERTVEQLRLIRAVEVLERARSPVARALLERWGGATTARWYRRQVGEALARWHWKTLPPNTLGESQRIGSAGSLSGSQEQPRIEYFLEERIWTTQDPPLLPQRVHGGIQ
jgi:WD40 repeat protein